MSRVIMFGCSLSHRPGIQQGLQKRYNCEVKNYSIGAGSNSIQMSMFDSYLLNEYRPDDVILWQVTKIKRKTASIIREHTRAKDMVPCLNDVEHVGSKVRYEKQNYFNQSLDRIYYLIHDNELNQQLHSDENTIAIGGDSHENIQNLASKFVMISRLTNRYHIYNGWSGVYAHSDEIDYSPQFDGLMRKWNINYQSGNPYVDWCMKNKLEMDTDGFHPMQSAGESYVDKVLHKRIGHFFSSLDPWCR